MAKPPLAELAAAGPPAEHFPAPPDDALDVLPDAHRRAGPPALPALDEATLSQHFADLAAVPGPTAWTAVESRPALWHCHPAQPVATVQGLLEAAHEVARALAALTGVERFSLQPPTLAAAERAALAVARAAFARAESQRTEVVLPADGPVAAAQGLGLIVRQVPRLAEGDLDVDAVMDVVGPQAVAVVVSWLTPGGCFERNLLAAGEVAHARGALLVADASGLASLAGRTRLAEAGVDACWLSLGELCPAATTAAVGVRTSLTEFLPSPILGKTREGYALDDDLPGTIGRLAAAPAPAADVLAAYAALVALGDAGLRARGARLALEAAARARGQPLARRPLASR
ncbi:MAG: hypothetical protein ACODAJ_16745 [Planctomycetota bacterium]